MTVTKGSKIALFLVIGHDLAFPNPDYVCQTTHSLVSLPLLLKESDSEVPLFFFSNEERHHLNGASILLPYTVAVIKADVKAKG